MMTSSFNSYCIVARSSMVDIKMIFISFLYRRSMALLIFFIHKSHMTPFLQWSITMICASAAVVYITMCTLSCKFAFAADADFLYVYLCSL